MVNNQITNRLQKLTIATVMIVLHVLVLEIVLRVSKNQMKVSSAAISLTSSPLPQANPNPFALFIAISSFSPSTSLLSYSGSSRVAKHV